MSDNLEPNDERPCLHCLIGDLIDEFYGEYGTLSGETNAIDVGEIMTALAKTVAEITYGSEAAERKRVMDDLTREIAEFEAEFHERDAAGVSTSTARH